MRRRAAWLGLLLMGCAHTHVQIPPTPEAQLCWRYCLMLYNQCIGPVVNPWEKICSKDNRKCQLSCPGAKEVDD
jgi:hypothetical protein